MSERLHRMARERGGGAAAAQGAEGPEDAAPLILRYDRARLAGEAARAAAGLAVTLGPLFFVRPLPAVEIVMLACGALFAVYLARTLGRFRSTVRVDADGLATEGLRAKRLAWPAVETVKLRFYNTRRGGGSGWMVLTVIGRDRGRRTKIVVESTLTGFNAVLKAAAEAAATGGLTLDESSRHNFAAAGHPIPVVGADAG